MVSRYPSNRRVDVSIDPTLMAGGGGGFGPTFRGPSYPPPQAANQNRMQLPRPANEPKRNWTRELTRLGLTTAVVVYTYPRTTTVGPTSGTIMVPGEAPSTTGHQLMWDRGAHVDPNPPPSPVETLGLAQYDASRYRWLTTANSDYDQHWYAFSDGANYPRSTWPNAQRYWWYMEFHHNINAFNYGWYVRAKWDRGVAGTQPNTGAWNAVSTTHSLVPAAQVSPWRYPSFDPWPLPILGLVQPPLPLPRWIKQPEGDPFIENLEPSNAAPAVRPGIDPFTAWDIMSRSEVRPHGRRTPKRGERERKVAVRGLFAYVAASYELVTEVEDAVEAIWKALPEKYRTGWKARDAYSTYRKRVLAVERESKLASMVKDLGAHWDKVNVEQAVLNLLVENTTDKVYRKTVVERRRQAAQKLFGNDRPWSFGSVV